jgi:putative oxidoreductase
MAGFYDSLSGWGVPLIRFFAGLILMPHGAQKLFAWFGGNPEGTAAFFEKVGLVPGMPLVILVGLVEFFGGACLAVGFLTRIAAAGIFIIMAVAVLKVHLGNGIFWTQGGFEYPLLWGLVALGFFLHGGGAKSVDRAIGREF